MEPTCRSSLWLGRSVCLSLPPPSPLIQAGTAPRAQPGALLTPLSPSPQLGALAVTLGVLLALLGCAAAPDPALEEAWEEWKSLHAKEYPGEDETFRREIWEKNLRHIQQHNWEEAQGKHSYRLAMNHFGDLVPADTFPGDPSEHPGLDRGIRDLLGHPGLDPGIRDPSVHPGLDLGIGDSLEHPGLDVGIRDPLVYPGLDPGTGYPHPVPRGAAGAPGARLLPGGQWLVGLCGAASRAPLASHGFSFGDLQTNEEFKRLLNGFIPAQQEELGRVFRASETLKTPVRVDWRAKGYVTPVKNQVGTGWGVWPRLWESGQQNRAAASSQSPQIFWATPRSSSRSFGHGDFVAETSTGEATASLPGGFWGSAMTPPLRFPPHPGVLRVLLGVQCHGGLGGADVQADGEAGGAERAEPHRLHPKAGQPRLLRWPHGMGLPVRARQRRPQLGACLPLRGHGQLPLPIQPPGQGGQLLRLREGGTGQRGGPGAGGGHRGPGVGVGGCQLLSLLQVGHLRLRLWQLENEPCHAGRGLRHNPDGWAQPQLLDPKEQLDREVGRAGLHVPAEGRRQPVWGGQPGQLPPALSQDSPTHTPAELPWLFPSGNGAFLRVQQEAIKSGMVNCPCHGIHMEWFGLEGTITLILYPWPPCPLFPQPPVPLSPLPPVPTAPCPCGPLSL
ncbi:uncharacterized protein LOC135403396 isoform X1 [Pseudopipra pipra]|uniref:uncharacterized protein LOC135403396 isoform X1 n=1 Tax=Pseudopipra pipra TaxID=415032 RepID=UPI003139A039